MINTIILFSSITWPFISYYFLKFIAFLQRKEKDKLKKQYEEWGYKGVLHNNTFAYEGTFVRPTDNSRAEFRIIKVHPKTPIVWAPSVLGILYLLLPFLVGR